MACEFTGRVKDFPVPSILKWIRRSGRTGNLVLDRKGTRGVIVFLDGEIVSARAGDRFADIGTLLLEDRAINRSQLMEAAERQRRAEQPLPLGRTLMEMGCATENDIRRAMRRQVDQVVEGLLELESGSFEFHAAIDVADDITQNVSEVLREAVVRRMVIA